MGQFSKLGSQFRSPESYGTLGNKDLRSDPQQRTIRILFEHMGVSENSGP